MKRAHPLLHQSMALPKARELPSVPGAGKRFVMRLLIRQENSDIVSHPFPQKARKWMGHPDSI
jgi:hypothetical protein